MPKPAISGQSPAVAFISIKARLFKVVTRNFYNSHIALVDSPNFNEHLGNAKRPIEASSCMILTRADVGRLIAVVKARRKSAIKEGAGKDRSELFDSGQQFDFMCWKEHGKGEKISGSFKYSMLKDGGIWYIHHLESVGPHSLTGGVLSPGELEHDDDSDHGHESDDGYETDESFKELRNMYSDDE
jgi:hypothetical protein